MHHSSKERKKKEVGKEEKEIEGYLEKLLRCTCTKKVN